MDPLGTTKFQTKITLSCARLPNGLKMRKFCRIMEQRTFKNVNNCLNTNIYSYLETSGGQSSTPYLNAVHFFNTRVKQIYVAA
jgi:hypothetical protein